VSKKLGTPWAFVVATVAVAAALVIFVLDGVPLMTMTVAMLTWIPFH
jgi:hypothetical protein